MARKAKGGDEDEVVEQDKVAAREGETPTVTETTDVEDIQLLADAVVGVIQTASFDDMTWNEVDHALRRASHLIKLNWAATGSVKPAPAEPPAA